MGLSHAQAVDVAKRLHPQPGRVLWFADDGSVLSRLEALPTVAAQRGEVYACHRPAAGRVVEVARVGATELGPGSEPSFGVPW